MNQQDKQHVFFSLVGSAMRTTGIENVLIVHECDGVFAVSLASTDGANEAIKNNLEQLRLYLSEVFAHATGDKGSAPVLTIIK